MTGRRAVRAAAAAAGHHRDGRLQRRDVPDRPGHRPDRERLAILDRLQAFGATALYDVMMRGLDGLARGSGRRALVVFTDGDDQASRATRAQVRAAAEVSDVTVYFVALGRGQAIEQLREGMEDLATLSGGRALRAPTGPRSSTSASARCWPNSPISI